MHHRNIEITELSQINDSTQCGISGRQCTLFYKYQGNINKVSQYFSDNSAFSNFVECLFTFTEFPYFVIDLDNLIEMGMNLNIPLMVDVFQTNDRLGLPFYQWLTTHNDILNIIEYLQISTDYFYIICSHPYEYNATILNGWYKAIIIDCNKVADLNKYLCIPSKTIYFELVNNKSVLTLTGYSPIIIIDNDYSIEHITISNRETGSVLVICNFCRKLKFIFGQRNKCEYVIDNCNIKYRLVN